MTQSTENAGPVVRAKAEAIQSAAGMARTALRGELQPEHLVFSLAPGQSNILWLTGHIAFAMDAITALATETQPVLPAGYASCFGRGSKPVADAAAYPPLAELLQVLDRAVEATVARALSLRDEEMARKLPESAPVSKIFPTVGDLLTGVVMHTAYHSGQIAMLRRAQGLPSGLGA